MSGMKIILSLALAVTIITMATAMPTPASELEHVNLLEYACGGTNVTSGAALTTKNCSCGEEIRQCNWSSLSVVGRFGESLSLTFCDMSHDVQVALPGVLKHACSVVDATSGSSIHSSTCPAPSGETPPDCDTSVAPLSAKISLSLVNAYFCPQTQDGAASQSADDDDDEEVDTCIGDESSASDESSESDSEESSESSDSS